MTSPIEIVLASDWFEARVESLILDRRHNGHTRDVRDRRRHPAKFVCRLPQPWRVPVAQGVLNRAQMLREVGSQGPTNAVEDGRVTAACGQQHTRVQERPSRGAAGCAGSGGPVDCRPQVGSLDRLGQEVVHAGRETSFAVFYP